MERKILTLLLTALLLCSCNGINNNVDNINNSITVEAYERPSLLNGTDVTYYEEYTPRLQSYSLNSDFSNIINPGDIASLSSEAKQKLLNNLFVITEAEATYHDAQYEFFGIYNDNSYYASKIPNFVTTDSLLHSFHLLYEYQQKQTEKKYLINMILDMSSLLLKNSEDQLELLRGTDWEKAAQRNVDYFSVAVALCGGTDYDDNETVETELKYIEDASGFFNSPIFTTEDRPYTQDYTQFIVRGYYTDTESLQRYFKVMMWFGQMTFTQVSEELNKSALLINLALKDDALKSFEAVYEITSFFAGESDDNSYYEYYPIIEFYFGDDVSVENIVEKEEEYTEYLKYIAELPKPKINSMYVVHEVEDKEKVTVGFRLLGQRVNLDGIIIENLTYTEVKESDSGEARVLPSALDVPAAFGSDLALSIINENEGDKWPTYQTQMEKVRQSVVEEGDSSFNKSVSSAWLGSLNPLLESKSEGWPSFMQSEAWNKKDLMTFLGGYTELKHDLILYQKQPENGKGGGDEEVFKDDRGYVEPEPNLYHRMSSILGTMINGLDSYKIIDPEDVETLSLLKDACDIFEDVSIKELNGDLPSDSQFEYIRRYGSLLEKIWKKYALDKSGKTWAFSSDYPNYLVTDIATDYDSGTCLELGEGAPMVIYVAVYFDGEIRIARGATYSIHEFVVPASDRLTDDKWKAVINSRDRSVIPPLPSWYENVYVETDYFYGSKYTGYENMINTSGSTLITSITTVNIRDYPSTKTGNKVGQLSPNKTIEYVSYVKNEGYIWYQIDWNQWVADDGTWFQRSSELNEDKYYKGAHKIEIMDSDMHIYSFSNTNNPTGGSVYNGEQYLVLSTWDGRINSLESNRKYVWYQIGTNMYIKDNGGDRVRIIE